MNPLQQLAEHGQSYWLDNLTRDMIDNGELARRVREEGLRGVTSNPSIFHAAIAGGSSYRRDIAAMARDGLAAPAILERLMVADIRAACDVLRPVYDDTDGGDGFVSLEVSPYLVHDTDGTIAEARRLFAEVDRPNVLIKIPGSPAGAAAIEQMLAEGVNVNITLLFSIDAYEAVAEAYLRALERRAAENLPLDRVASVASFFLSRIDVLVDRLLGQRLRPGSGADGGPSPERLLGRTAIANARLAYLSFERLFSGPRWSRLADRGARVQRLLWASTSTKNPLYSDVRYVEPLIGPHTVNTMPDATVAAFADHGRVRPDTVRQDVAEAKAEMAELAQHGIDLGAVTSQLLDEGMTKFTTPYDGLLRTLQQERQRELGAAAGGAAVSGLDLSDVAEALDQRRFGARLEARDPTLWSRDPDTMAAIADRLGWLDAPAAFRDRVEELERFAAAAADDGLRRAVVLGMGGSSRWAAMSAAIFAPAPDRLELTVLDSTDPDAIRAVEDQVELGCTLFVVASKSGTTAETLSLYRHFAERAREQLGDAAAGHFVAITDAGSPLADEATDAGFRHLFTNPADIGGRYSALTYFGLVPMALLGVDLATLLDRAAVQLASCDGQVPADTNPGLELGAALGHAASGGRDKVTLVFDDAVAPFGWWLEQLLAESTGKAGRGLVPVTGEPLGAPEVYGDDRVFVSTSVGGPQDEATEKALAALQEAGAPVIRIVLDEPLDLGAEAVRWEVAVAAAGAVLGINPFDEPNVAESKRNTRQLLERWQRRHAFDEPEPAARAGGAAVWRGDSNGHSDVATPAAALRRLLADLAPGDYFALLPFLARDEHRDELLQRLRLAVRDRHHVATTLGYGPRYLHSTGQLFKGGPATGCFVVITDEPRQEVSIPDHEHDFATLLRAQALGDFRALADHDRRVLRLHLAERPEAALEALVDELVAS